MKDKIINMFSRKFLLTALTTIIGLATLVTNTDDVKVQIIALIVVLVAQVVYNIVEGNIDAKSVISQAASAMTKIDQLLDQIQDTEDPAKGSTDTEKSMEAVKKATESGEQ